MRKKTSPSLRELQKTFSRRLKTGVESQPGDLADWIRESHGFSRLQRLRVYHEDYRVRLENSLTKNFPRLREILGEKKFATLVAKFVSERPSRHYNLSDYSQDFLKHLRTARLSKKAFSAAVLDGAEALASFAYDLQDSREVLSFSKDVPVVRSNPSLRWAGPVAVWRIHETVYHRRLTATEKRILAVLAKPLPLEKLATRLSLYKISEKKAALIMQTLASEGLVALEMPLHSSTP